MAKAHFEHRRRQQRLDQHVARIARPQHAEETLERKAVARVQREQHAVVDRRGLDFEIERLAQALANREPQPAIEPNSERRVDDDLRAAEAVEEALDDHRLLVGNRAERLDPAAHVVGGLRRRALAHRAFGHQPFFGRFVALEAVPDLVTQLADFRRQRRRSAARLGLPERQRRRHPGRRLDHQAPARDSLDLPRHRAEREHVAARRLLREVLLDVADLAALRLDHDVVVAGFGNRSARGDRRQIRADRRGRTRASTRSKKIFGAAPMIRSGYLGGHLFEQMPQFGRVEIAEVVRAAEQAQQLGLRDFVFLGGDRDDLLRRDVDASRRNFHFVEMPGANRAHRRAAFEQIVGRQREEAPLRRRAEAVARAADPLNRGRDRFRRIELADRARPRQRRCRVRVTRSRRSPSARRA